METARELGPLSEYEAALALAAPFRQRRRRQLQQGGNGHGVRRGVVVVVVVVVWVVVLLGGCWPWRRLFASACGGGSCSKGRGRGMG